MSTFEIFLLIEKGIHNNVFNHVNMFYENFVKHVSKDNKLNSVIKIEIISCWKCLLILFCTYVNIFAFLHLCIIIIIIRLKCQFHLKWVARLLCLF